MIQKSKVSDPNSKPNIFKSNLISHTNVGEITLSHRLEAKILKQAVDTILSSQKLGNAGFESSIN